MGSLFVNVDRLNAISFLSPHSFVPVTYITSWPDDQSDSLTEIIEQDFFLYNLATIIITSFILAILAMITKVQLSKLLWILFCIVLGKSYDTNSIKHTSIKILLTACQVSNFFIMIFISGKLYESITLGKSLNTINSLVELDKAIKDNQVQFYVEQADYGYISEVSK